MVEKRECTCTICGKKYLSNRIKTFTCGNRKCSDRSNYLRHREVYIENARRWDAAHPEETKLRSKKSCDKFRKNKPERFNELMMNGYKKHKDRWLSRSKTGKIANGRSGYKLYNPMKKTCHCGSTENMELHHEEYPKTVEEIKKAMDEGKIYYKCRKCHGRRNGHKKTN